MHIENEIKLNYDDVLIRPKRSTLGSRKAVDLERGFNFPNYQPKQGNNPDLLPKGYPAGPYPEEKHYRGIPIIASNMDGVGTFEMADKLAEQKIMTCLVKTYSVDELVSFYDGDIDSKRKDFVAYSMGITENDEQKFKVVYQQTSNIKYVCIDVANGYSERFIDFVREFRMNYPHVVIIAGNVVTADQTQELILNGADIVKVGIGPGSVCTTRIQTGVGYPQLSAVMECADAAHGLNGHIIADGGCTCPGDVAKAFAGGADYVMLGGMLAGHDEGGGKIVTKHIATGGAYKTSEGTFVPYFEEQNFIQFYGMSSDAANTKHFGGLKDYRASEGREVLVPYRGNVENTIQTILGGIRSTCTYAGAKRLKHLSKCATFVRTNSQFNRTYESTTTKM
tara:strand:+ start:680 stop:1861 length:1182 start_codon:yes stop_codon:yes gene_type:complete